MQDHQQNAQESKLLAIAREACKAGPEGHWLALSAEPTCLIKPGRQQGGNHEKTSRGRQNDPARAHAKQDQDQQPPRRRQGAAIEEADHRVRHQIAPAGIQPHPGTVGRDLPDGEPARRKDCIAWHETLPPLAPQAQSPRDWSRKLAQRRFANLIFIKDGARL